MVKLVKCQNGHRNEIPNLVEVDVQFLLQLSQILLLRLGWKKIGHGTRNQINDTFLFQNRVKVKVVGEVSEK